MIHLHHSVVVERKSLTSVWGKGDAGKAGLEQLSLWLLWLLHTQKPSLGVLGHLDSWDGQIGLSRPSLPILG